MSGVSALSFEIRDTKSNAYINEFNKANKKRAAATRNCIAVPVVKIPNKKKKATSFNIKSFKLNRFKLKGLRFRALKVKLPNIKLFSIKLPKIKLDSIKLPSINLDRVTNIIDINMIRKHIDFIYYYRTKVAITATSVLLAASIGVAAAYQSRQTGYEVFMGETLVGIVSTQEDFNQHFERVQDDLGALIENGMITDKQPSFVEGKFWSNNFSSQKAIEKNIRAIVDIIVPAYAIIVDGKQMGILKDKQTADELLNRLKEQYGSESSDVKVDFDKDVRIENMTVKLKDINDSEQVYAVLAGHEDSIKTYKVKKSDTLWDIAIDHRMPIDELVRLNPGISERIQPGDEIRLSVPKPVLGVMTREKIEYTEGIPFNIAEIKDPNLYVGRRTIVERGSNGKKKIEAEIIRINGIETDKQVLNEVVLAEPKAQKEKVGTKPTPPKFATGKFGRPVYGNLTSRFGYRWGRMHTGIDLAAPIGTPVYASDGGKVIFAGWEGAYGYLIKIVHDNEYTTYYGHLSKMSVKSGQRVAKGELIGNVGNTGRSTGPHLHFEVRKNGTPVNPLDFLNK